MPNPVIPHAEILARLKTVLDEEMTALQDAYGHRSLSTVAWIARNLLELLVWTKYCAVSEQNANSFVADALRDSIDAIGVATKISIDKAVSFAQLKDNLIQTAAAGGFEELDRSYKLDDRSLIN
jgi:hypothetical protein